MSHSAYRPDVDGLRAVAVLLVLFFHADLGFPGGFVGVDVFFVISGYLITGLILREQAAGKFQLATFWSRRIRRIVPAAAALSAATLLAGAMLLFPVDYAELGESALAHQVLVANIYFWQHTGYFAGPADLKPLLHTWSLAVEEQFYVVYPLVLMVLHRYGRRKMFALLTVVAGLSLIASELGVRSSPSATFYLLPTRAWELLLGGLLCFLPVPAERQKSLFPLAGLVGLGMILACALWYTRQTKFPGLAALPPCLGAALIMHSNAGRLNFTGRLLSLRPVVFIGLISYSLYLWHWPLLAFSRYWLGEELPPGVVLGVLAASLVLATLSWRYVETPLRRPRPGESPGRVVAGLCCTAPVLVACSLLVLFSDGFPRRIPEAALRYQAARDSRAFTTEVSLEQVRQENLPAIGDPQGTATCLIWGDSHAMAVVPGLDAALREMSLKGYQATHSGKPPLPASTLPMTEEQRAEHLEYLRGLARFAKEQRLKGVLLSAAWHSYAGDEHFPQQLTESMEAFRDEGLQVAIVLDAALFPDQVPKLLASRAFFGLPTSTVGVSREEYQELNRRAETVIRDVARGRAEVLDPAPAFVDSQGFWRAEIGGESMYRDRSHLSVAGGRRTKDMFAAWLATLPR